MELAVQKYIEEAKHCLFNQNYGKAYAFYLLVLKLSPHLQHVVKNDFVAAWREWSFQLQNLGRIEDLFAMYEQGCDALMKCEMLHYHMGNALFQLHYKVEAIGMFRKAIFLDEHCLEASISLENACRGVIDSWHFSMLNDKQRNLAFEKAIKNVIKHDDVAFDIGSGTGILSMMAARNGTNNIYACEMSEALHSVANECVIANKFETSIKLLNCHSTKLVVNASTDSLTTIPQNCSVVITETVDAGLLGEGIIENLDHAWKNILISSSNGGRVIPGSATVYCCLVECEKLYSKHVATSKHNLPGILITSGVGFKEKCSDTFVNTCVLEPYTSETLCNFNFRALTKPQQLISFDFNDAELVEQLASNALSDIVTEHRVLETGFADAVVFWFDLELDSKSNTINTCIGTDHCWDQAVYPIRDFNNILAPSKNECIVPKRVQVQENDVLKTVFQVHCDCFYLDFLTVKSLQDSSIQTFSQKYSSESLLHVVATEEQIQRINDATFSNMCFRSLCEIKNWSESFTMLDISNGFDLFAVKTAKVAKATVHKYCQTAAIADALMRMTKKCNIPVCIHKTLPPSGDAKFDAIVSHVIEPSGLISPNAISNICKVKSLLSWSGFILPNCVSLIVQCIESEELLSKCMVLSDDSTLGLKIAETINDFRVSVHSDLNIYCLNYTPITTPKTILQFDFNNANSESLLSMRKSIVIKATCSGTLHAVLFWFKINVHDKEVLITNAKSNHWKQAAYVFSRKKQINLSKDDEIVLKAITNDDSILFQVSTYGA